MGRLTESCVELRLREIGKRIGVEKVHPHKFRRTMATRAIEKGYANRTSAEKTRGWIFMNLLTIQRSEK